MVRASRLAWSAALVLCAQAAASPPAAVSPIEVRLAYERGPGAERCPTEAELRDGVMARLGRDPFRDSAPRLIRVTIARAGAGLQARIETVEGRGAVAGERSLASPGADCVELGAVVGLALAIAIDPMAASGRPPDTWDDSAAGSQPTSSQPASPGSDAPELAPTPVSYPPRTDAVATLRAAPGRPLDTHAPLTWFASGGVLLAVGAAPGVTGGLALQVGVRRGSFSFAVEGRADLPREASVGDGGVRASLGLAAVVPCYRWGRFAACGLVAAGGFRGAAHNLGLARQELTPFVAAGARAAVDFKLGRRLWISTHADLLAPLTPTTLAVDEVRVWRTPSVSGAFGVTLAGCLY